MGCWMWPPLCCYPGATSVRNDTLLARQNKRLPHCTASDLPPGCSTVAACSCFLTSR